MQSSRKASPHPAQVQQVVGNQQDNQYESLEERHEHMEAGGKHYCEMYVT